MTHTTLLIGSAVDKLGHVLLHAVWQITALWLIAVAATHLLRRRSANERYLVLATILLAMFAAPIITWLLAEPTHLRHALTPSIGETQTYTSGIPLTQLVKWIYVPGVFLFGLWHFVGLVRLRKIQADPYLAALNDSDWTHRLNRLAGLIGVRRRVRLVKSPHLSVPAVIGFFKPIILIPISIANDLTVNQLEAIVAHELAHIRRHDYLVNLVQSAIETILFFHPGVWWVSNRMRHEREFCCDDLVVSLLNDPRTYALALRDVAVHAASVPQHALAASGKPLLARVERVLGLNRHHQIVSRKSWAVLLSTAILAVTLISQPLVQIKAEITSTIYQVAQNLGLSTQSDSASENDPSIASHAHGSDPTDSSSFFAQRKNEYQKYLNVDSNTKPHASSSTISPRLRHPDRSKSGSGNKFSPRNQISPNTTNTDHAAHRRFSDLDINKPIPSNPYRHGSLTHAPPPLQNSPPAPLFPNTPYIKPPTHSLAETNPERRIPFRGNQTVPFQNFAPATFSLPPNFFDYDQDNSYESNPFKLDIDQQLNIRNVQPNEVAFLATGTDDALDELVGLVSESMTPTTSGELAGAVRALGTSQDIILDSIFTGRDDFSVGISSSRSFNFVAGDISFELSGTTSSSTPVPEPTTMVLTLSLFSPLLIRRKRRNC